MKKILIIVVVLFLTNCTKMEQETLNDKMSNPNYPAFSESKFAFEEVVNVYDLTHENYAVFAVKSNSESSFKVGVEALKTAHIQIYNPPCLSFSKKQQKYQKKGFPIVSKNDIIIQATHRSFAKNKAVKLSILFGEESTSNKTSTTVVGYQSVWFSYYASTHQIYHYLSPADYTDFDQSNTRQVEAFTLYPQTTHFDSQGFYSNRVLHASAPFHSIKFDISYW